MKDHCGALWSILTQGSVGSKYNVPGGYEISNIELAKLVCSTIDRLCPAEFNYESLLTFVDDRLGHDWRYAINGQKIHEECGWKANIEFAKGIEDTVKWYLMLGFENTKLSVKA